MMGLKSHQPRDGITAVGMTIGADHLQMKRDVASAQQELFNNLHLQLLLLQLLLRKHQHQTQLLR